MQPPRVPHLFVVLYTLMRRFHRLTSWWTYAALLVAPILFAITCLQLPIKKEFFFTNLDDYNHLADACTFISLQTEPQHRATFLAAYKNFFGIKKLMTIKRPEYDFVMDKQASEKQFFYTNSCYISNFVHARFFPRPDHFEISLRHRLFADKLDLLMLGSKFYPTQPPTVLPQREQFIRYLLKTMNNVYGTKTNLSTVNITSMDPRVRTYIDHSTSSFRQVFLLAAMYLSVWSLPNTFDRDLKNGFLDMLQATNRFQFAHYIYARYLWCLLCGLQLLNMIGLQVLVYFWNHITSPIDILVIQLAAYLLLYDIHVSYIWIHLNFGRKSAIANFVTGLVAYLMTIAAVDQYVSSWPLDYPQWIIPLRIVTSIIVPGIAFQWFFEFVIAHGQYFHLRDKQFSHYISSPYNDTFYYLAVVALLGFYLAVVVIKTLVCSAQYRILFGNIYERQWLSLWFGPAVKLHPNCEIFQPNPNAQQPLTENTSEQGMRAEQQPSATSQTERLVALRFVDIKKKCGRLRIKIGQMMALYERVTVFYAFSDRQSSSIICRLAAGYAKPNRGQVQLFPNKNKVAKVAFVVTKHLNLANLTVLEYMKLFCVVHQVPLAVKYSRMAGILNFLGLRPLANTPTDRLTSFEQLKLSTGIALLSQCTVLVLDNPTKAVALEDKREFWEILFKLKIQGKAIFLSTNSMEEVDYVADYVILFYNGCIRASGRPDELKRAHLRDDFCMRISKTSLMSRQEIEDFFQKAATEKSEGEHGEATPPEASTQARRKRGRVCVYKKDNFNEHIFTFKFDTGEQKRAMTKVLDALYEKGARDAKKAAQVESQFQFLPDHNLFSQIALNSISRNTLEDSFEAIYSSIPHKKSDQPNVAPLEEMLPDLDLPDDEASRRPTPSQWNIFGALLWMRLNTLLRWPPWVIIGIAFWAIFFRFVYWVCSEAIVGHNIMTMTKRHPAVHWAEVKDKVNGSWSRARPDNGSLEDINYRAWVIPGARSFADYAANYRAAYRLAVGPESQYHLDYVYNPYSPHPELFDLLYPFTAIVHSELSARKINFTFELDYFGHFRLGSDVFDHLQAAWLLTGSVPIATIIALFIFMDDSHQMNQHGWMGYLRANGMSQSIYVPLQLVSYYYAICVGFYTGNTIFKLLIPKQFYMARPFDLIYLFFFMGILALVGGFALLIETFFLRWQFLAVLIHLALAFFIEVNICWSVSSWNISKEAYNAIQAPAMLSPSGIIISQILKPFVTQYPSLMEQFRRYNANIALDPEYWYSWEMRHLISLHIWVAIFYAICLYQVRYLLWQYRSGEQKQVTFLAHTTKDVDLYLEDLAVTRTLQMQSNADPEVLFVVQKLCHHSGQRPLDGITFRVKRGECFGVYGLRGAGKSRLLEVLTGVRPFEEGDFYLWDAKNGFGDTSEDKSQVARFKRMDPCSIAYCPATNCIEPRLTVFESLIVFAKLRVVPKAQLWSQVRHVAVLFQLETVLSKKCIHLTQYEARLLTLAMTFIGRSKLVLLDHPSDNVETYQKGSIWNILLNAKKAFNSTIILASSNSSEVEALCDRIAVMIQGSFRFIGPDHKLRAKHCKGIDITLKVTPAKLKEPQYMLELRTKMITTFAGIKSMSTHKYVLNYHLPGENIRLSAVIEQLESLRLKFNLETYSLNVASLNEMFYHYAVSKDKKNLQKKGEEDTSKTKPRLSSSKSIMDATSTSPKTTSAGS